MAVAYDSGSAISATCGNVASVSFSVTVGAGTNRCLIVNAAQRHADTTVTGISHDTTAGAGGTAMTLVSSLRSPSVAATDLRLTMYRLVAPASGTKEVTIYFSVTDVNLSGAVGAEAFTGVDQTTPLGTINTESDESDALADVTVTTTAGDMLAVAFGIQGTHSALALDTSGGGVSLYTVLNSVLEGAAGYIAADAASETLTYTWTTIRRHCMIGAPLRQAVSVTQRRYGPGQAVNRASTY